MEIVDSNQTQWARVSGHRDGDIRFKRLFMGREGTPENYEFSLVATRGAFTTPRHRHNFEQIRFCLEGAVNFGPGKDVKAGQVGYFPEGTPYGPQAITDQLVMVVQFGGASGQGFMSYRQLDDGYRDMKAQGEFKDGIFRRADGAGRKNQDSYEAIWEMVNGQRLAYPKPRYEEPVLMDPSAFEWRADAAHAGVARKLLGVFSERGLRLEMLRLEAASLQLASGNAEILGFVVGGALQHDGQDLAAGTALRIAAGTNGVLAAKASAELLVMTFPPIPPAVQAPLRNEAAA
jgi:quercetin dioxygenase-like cupin family protein